MLSESWDWKKDRAYLCGCMAAWHSVMSTLIKHGGHSQTSAGEGSALQARRSGPGDVSLILTGRSPHRQDTRPRLIGGNVSWVIIFVQCRQGQHCECQRQGKENKHRARPSTWKIAVFFKYTNPVEQCSRASCDRICRWVSWVEGLKAEMAANRQWAEGHYGSSAEASIFFLRRGPLFKLLPPSWLTQRRVDKTPCVFWRFKKTGTREPYSGIS